MEQRNERRSYYRIDDVIGLTYTVLDKNNPVSASPSDLGLSLTTLLAEIDHEFNQTVNTLWHEDPTTAKALGLLNKKLSMIAAHSLQDEEQDIEPYEDMLVNISGCGISFSCEEQLSEGTQLQLSLILKPSNVNLSFVGNVISCKKQSLDNQKPYHIRVSFEENSAAQEQLIQHIVQKQCAQIGEQKRMFVSEEDA